MTANKKGMMWVFDNLEYMKLISINERQPREVWTKAFEVTLDVKFKLGGGGENMTNGKTTWDCLLKQDTHARPGSSMIGVYRSSRTPEIRWQGVPTATREALWWITLQEFCRPCRN